MEVLAAESTLNILQEQDGRCPTRAAVSELHSGSPLSGAWVAFRLALHNLEHPNQTPQYQIHPRRGLREKTGI